MGVLAHLLVASSVAIAALTLALPSGRAVEPPTQPAQTQARDVRPCKPPPGTEINWKHPLAEGLVSAVPLNEGAGNAFYDAATKETYTAKALPGTPKDGQPPAWITPPLTADYPWGGPAISNNNATAQSIRSPKLATELLNNVTHGYSYAALFQPLSLVKLGRILDTTSNAPMVMYMLDQPQYGRAQSISATWCDAKDVAINPLYKYTMNKWILVLCTVRQGLGIMYVNGVEVARSTKVDLAWSVAGQKGNLHYNTTGGGSMMFDANFSSFWAWNNRVLTAREAAQFYANPWAMFGPAAPTAPATNSSPATKEATK